MAKKEKNWDIVKGQKKSETMRFRDVYEDQQLERSSIAPKQTMASRNILAACVGLFGFFVVWLVVTLVQMLKFTPTLEISQDPAGLYYHVTEGFYYNKEDW